MSDNEDLLGDDLGDHSLADYNLGNDEEEQLLADDYESGPQNVPTSIDPNYTDGNDISSSNFPGHAMPYSQQPIIYQAPVEECVVPNITVEVPNTPIREVPTYAPYQPPVYEAELAVVPPAIPAAPMESPQIVPSELNTAIPNGEGRERFMSERPPGAPQRTPQLRDIPDSLDKVLVGGYGAGGVPAGRGRTSWRSPQFQARFPPPPYNHPYRRNNVQRGKFVPPAPEPRDPPFRPMERPPFQNYQRFPLERPNFRPNYEPRFFQRPPYNAGPFGPSAPVREVIPNSSQTPQITINIRQALPGLPLPQNVPKIEEFGPKREPEVRMLPVQLPPNLPPGGLAGKKVLINPHFKGNFQPPTEGPPAPTYIPTRIQKSPPLSPTLENKFGPIKDIDDAAERFIAEQRNALARAAGRKFTRRSPQRFIENTTIEVENELAPAEPPWRADDDLLRRQEEFINSNMAGLRRRMRSPSPARRSPSPRRSPERRSPDRRSPERRRAERRPPDEESEYRRRVREQESLRERVLRAKEVRRKRNAVALHKLLQDRERERNEPKDPKPEPKPEPKPPSPDSKPSTTSPELDKPDTTRCSPERVEKKRERSPVKETAEINSTCENLTPPRLGALTPPLPAAAAPPAPPAAAPDAPDADADDDLELILGDLDDMLSDDTDSGRFKHTATRPEPPKPKPQVDLRSRLPPKAETKRPPRQKIVFAEEKEQRKRKGKDKSPPAKKPAVTSSTKPETHNSERKSTKTKQSSELSSNKSRPRIIFDNKEPPKEREDKPKPSSRRVVIQRKATQSEKSVFSRIEVKTDPTQAHPGIFSRAVRTAIGAEARPPPRREEPAVEYESDEELDEDSLLNDDSAYLVASVTNLPHGITDTRLKTLAGGDVQSLSLDKKDRSAKITFRTTVAADAFRKKFNNKMVAASRLTVTLR